MCNEAVRREPYTLWHVPDHFRTQKMCNEAIKEDQYTLKFLPDPLRTQKMCDDAVWGDAFSLQYVPDYFVTQQQIKIWHDNDHVTTMMNLLSGIMIIIDEKHKNQK